MKVSIITVCYNSAETIEDTIKSVVEQTFKNVEFIIIDGGSTDGTHAIIEKYKDKIASFTSEPDEGIFDAMNKGVKKATGDVIGILNSDDFYKTNESIALVAEVFESDSDTLAVYGDIEYVNKTDTDKIVRYWRSGRFKRGKMQYGWMPPHPSFFVRRQVYEKYGVFDTAFKISADYELMLRMLYKHKIKAAYINKTLVKMRIGGNSGGGIKNRIKANNEDKLARKVNNLNYSFFFTILKPIRKLPQFVLKGKN